MFVPFMAKKPEAWASFCYYVASARFICYNINVSMSSQIRLRLVHGNVGGIVSLDMDALVCGTCLPCILVMYLHPGTDIRI